VQPLSKPGTAGGGMGKHLRQALWEIYQGARNRSLECAQELDCASERIANLEAENDELRAICTELALGDYESKI